MGTSINDELDLQSEVESLKKENQILENEAKNLRQRVFDLESMLNHASAPLFLKDTDGKYIFANRCFEKLSHVPSEDLIGNDDGSVFAEPVATLFGAQDQEVIVAGEAKEFEESVALPDGELHFITLKFPVFDAEDRLYAVGGFCTDITERKKVEEALRSSEERFRVAFDTSRDSISISTLDGIFVDVNQGFLALTGHVRDEVIGKPAAEIQIWETPADREIFVGILRSSGSAIDFEAQFRLKNGKIAIALLSANIISLNGAPHILTVGRDITKRKQAEEERESLQAQLHRAQKLESVGILAGGIAHDFNNILSAILGNIDLALLDNGGLKKAPLLEQAKRACQRAKGLTHQLLTFAKGGDPIKRVSSIADVVRETADFVLRGSNTRCDYVIAEDLPRVEIDPGQISQVIQNLIINAQQAMNGQGVIQVTIGAQCLERGQDHPSASGSYVRIDVNDTGPGISAGCLHRIFEPYFTTKEQGSGLGLAVCHSTIAKHDGELIVESEEGRGTTFSVFLPVTSKELSASVDSTAARGAQHSGRILIMDDDEMIRDIAQNILVSVGYQVVLAKDGAEAIRLYEWACNGGDSIDLVILDLTVPGGMSGQDALTGILEINKDARVIVSSGYSTDPIMARHQEYGFCGAISKPFEVSEFLGVVTENLRD